MSYGQKRSRATYQSMLFAPGPKRTYVRKPAASAGRSLLARKVAALNRMVELKLVERSAASTQVEDTGSLADVSELAQGDTSLTRTGIAILPTKVVVRQQYDASAATADSVVRMMIVQSKMGALVLADFPTFAACLTPAQLAKYNVLYDKRTLLSTTAGEATPQIAELTIECMPSRKVWYTEGSNFAISGGIYTFYVSNIAAASEGPLLLNYDAGLYFKDA